MSKIFKPTGTRPSATTRRVESVLQLAKAKMDKEDKEEISRARASVGLAHKFTGLVVGLATLTSIATTEAATIQSVQEKPYIPISQNQPYSPENKINHYEHKAILQKEDYIPGITETKF